MKPTPLQESTGASANEPLGRKQTACASRRASKQAGLPRQALAWLLEYQKQQKEVAEEAAHVFGRGFRGLQGSLGLHWAAGFSPPPRHGRRRPLGPQARQNLWRVEVVGTGKANKYYDMI